MANAQMFNLLYAYLYMYNTNKARSKNMSASVEEHYIYTIYLE